MFSPLIVDTPPLLSPITNLHGFNDPVNVASDVFQDVNKENQDPPQLCVNYFTFSFQDCAAACDTEHDGVETNIDSNSNSLTNQPKENIEQSTVSNSPTENENYLNQHCSLTNTTENFFRRNQRKRRLASSNDDNKTKKPMISAFDNFFKSPNWNDNVDMCFKITKPSIQQLKNVCLKLNLKYRDSAYKFWGKIKYEKIPAISQHLKLHIIKAQSIYDCFSVLFTGFKGQSYLFKRAIEEAFNAELVAEQMSQCLIDRIMNNPTITVHHLEFITRYLSCRIGIYENQKLRKYGRWMEENNDDELTIILAKNNENFSIVLNV